MSNRKQVLFYKHLSHTCLREDREYRGSRAPWSHKMLPDRSSVSRFVILSTPAQYTGTLNNRAEELSVPIIYVGPEAYKLVVLTGIVPRNV